MCATLTPETEDTDQADLEHLPLRDLARSDLPQAAVEMEIAYRQTVLLRRQARALETMRQHQAWVPILLVAIAFLLLAQLVVDALAL